MKTAPAYLLLVGLAIIMGGLFRHQIKQAVQINWLSLQVNQATLVDPAGMQNVHTQLEQAARQSCHLNWFLGLIAGRMGDLTTQQAAWSDFLACHSPAALHLVHAGAPGDPTLAQQAAGLYPDQAESWFWLAEISAGQDQLDRAIQSYQRVVQLNPTSGLAWCRLGSLLEKQDLIQAQTAFLNCCYMGDPGSNGCYNAGRIEETTGNIATAILYYRRSHWSGAQKRAYELEQSLESKP